MEKDEFFIKRIRELANLSYQRDIVTFTDFLNLNEQNMLATLKLRQMGVSVKLFGGYDHAERQMAAWRENQRTPLFFQLVGKINRGLIIDMAVVDSFNSFWILAQHALVDRPVCLRLLHKIARI